MKQNNFVYTKDHKFYKQVQTGQSDTCTGFKRPWNSHRNCKDDLKGRKAVRSSRWGNIWKKVMRAFQPLPDCSVLNVARQKGCSCNSACLPLSLSVQLLYRGFYDFLLKRGVFFYHPPGSFQILREVFPRYCFLHLLKSSQHLCGVTRELLKRHTHLD